MVNSTFKGILSRYTASLVIYEDNKACLEYSKNSMSHQRTKHISVRYHFRRHDLSQARTIGFDPVYGQYS